MAATRLELNLMRLLSRCEALAAERRDPEEWRLEKVRPGPASRGESGREKRGNLPPLSPAAAREPPPDEARPVSAAGRSDPDLALSRAFATQYFHLQAFSPQYVAALEDMLRELKLQSW